MKTIKSLLVIALVFTFTNVNSQILSPRAQERENNEVNILSAEELWDLQLWFHQEVQKMNLDVVTQADYESNYLLYTSKMMRLDDKDKDYTYEEIVVKLDVYFNQLNNAMKDILTTEQFKIHEDNANILHNYVSLKMEKPEYLAKL